MGNNEKEIYDIITETQDYEWNEFVKNHEIELIAEFINQHLKEWHEFLNNYKTELIYKYS